jgi:hypothetical protein
MALDFQESKHNSNLSIKISKNVNILPIIKSNFKKLQKHLINLNKPPNVCKKLQFIKFNLQESKQTSNS